MSSQTCFEEPHGTNRREDVNGIDFQQKKKVVGKPSDKIQQEKVFEANLYINKDHCCNAKFTLLNTHVKRLPRTVRNIITHDNENPLEPVSLRVVDLCPKSSLLLFKCYEKESQDNFDFPLNNSLPQLTIEPQFEKDRTILAFMKGLLTRNAEMAVIELPNTDYQMFMYYKEDKEQDIEASLELDDFNVPAFSVSFCAVIVNRYNLVLDLDNTLIKTRKAKDDEVAKTRLARDGFKIREEEFRVDCDRYLCLVRPGTELLLGWASKLFKIYIVTNAIYSYAKEVVKILDPRREHLLRKFRDVDFDVTQDERLKEFVKSREDLVPVDHIPKPLGMKDLQKWDLNSFSSVIFDDDVNIWKNSQQICVLPFDDIVQHKHPSALFKALRTSIWSRFATLARKKDKLRTRMDKNKKQSQTTTATPNIVLSQVVTYSQQHVFDQL